jgi:hypothetical protein
MTRSTKPVLGRPVAALLLLATLCQGPALAFAQVTAPATPAAPTPPAAAAPSDAAPAPAAAPDPAAAKAEARARFDRGLTLLREEAWGPALAEFLASRKLYPTRNATTNAAICLRKLQRYDESLGMYETLLREFAELPADDKTAAQRAIAELRELVGTLEVGGAQPGAVIVVDGQERAEYPTIEPLRVNAGSHTVRLYKEGYEPFETRVDVAGGKIAQVTATMRALAESGRLKVVEQGGRAVELVVDNVAVGTTPWEGLLGLGDHTVVLRGEGRLGTAPARVRVTKGATASLVLRAEELDGSLRIEPVPVSAAVSIDGVAVGNGQWVGRLRSGSHRIEVSSEGFLTATRKLELAKNEHQNLRVELDRDEEAPVWRKPSKITVEARGGLPFAPSLGGAPQDDCGDGCTAELGLGGFVAALATYELGSGFGVGLSVGYLGLGQKVAGHDGELIPAVNLDPRPARIDDQRGLSGFLAGAVVGQRFGEQFPVTLRLGLGAYFANLHTLREGSFTTRSGEEFDLAASEQDVSATFFYAEPEVRVGYRLSPNLEVALGVSALALIAPSTPSWDETTAFDAGSDGVGTYPADELTGSFIVLPMPALSVRYDY